MPDGKVVLDETPASFAAKDALASIEGDYVEKGQKRFDDKVAEYVLKNKIADADILFKKMKGANDAVKTRAYAANMYSQIKAREGNPEEQTKIADDVYTRNLLQQSKLIVPFEGSKIAQAKIENKNSLPIFTFNSQGKPTLLAPKGGTPIKDKSGKIIAYEGGHWTQQYLEGKTPIELSNILTMYRQDLPELKKNGFVGGVDEYLKGLIKDGIVNVKLIGANGSSDKGINTSALKAISNPLTKKDQEGVFEMPLEPEE